MKRQFIGSALILSTLFTISACQNEQAPMEYSESIAEADYAMAPPPAPMRAQKMSADVSSPVGGAVGQSTRPVPPQQNGNPSDVSFLAYRYNYSYQLPAKAVVKTAKTHAELCQKAGPSQCQLLSSSSSQHSETNSFARLSLRVAPNWLDTFTGEVSKSISEEDGVLKDSGVSAEDLTRSILDTDARLNALRTLRIRLQKLLETKNADLKDLLALERELSRVQGQIESTTSQLNVLRKRVSMSVIDINYQSKPVAVSRETVSPIGRALKDFIGNISYGIASVINVIAYILPWFILIIPVLWLMRRFWRRRKNT